MASRHQILCINKANRYSAHERIHRIGGVNADGSRWAMLQQDAVVAIDTGKFSFFVKQDGHEVNVITATHNGNKYIKTVADGEQPNNLLSLPECP